MGFFSGIADAVKGVVGGIGDVISSPVSSLLGSGLEYLGGRQANAQTAASTAQQLAFQREENQRAMDFSERMAGTSYQRVVKDLRKAGLNPALAYGQGGAATPSGVTSSGASYQAQNPVRGNAFAQAASTAQQLASTEQIAAQVENIRADTDVKRAEAAAAGEYYGSRAWRETGEANRSRNEADRSKRELNAGSPEAQVENIRANTAQSMASAENVRAMNIAIKSLNENEATKPIAAILQLLLRK